MAKRRQNGEGTIYQRPNGLWVCEVTIGYDKDKKRIKKTFSSMDLEKLQKKINDAKFLNDRKMLNAPSDSTLSEWLDFWLVTYKKEQVKPTTYDMYYGAVERYIKPNLGHYKIDKINPLLVQKLINDLSHKSLNTDGMSTSSLKKIIITLSQAYDKAIALNMVYENPCKDIQLPKKKSREALAFSPEEQDVFISNCSTESSYDNMFVFDFNTGMRQGELMALTWSDVDFEKNEIHITKNLSIVGDYDENSQKKLKIIISDTKTANSERIVPLNKKALEILKIQQKQNKADSPFVFYSSSGTPAIKRNIYRAFEKVIKKSNIFSSVTFHSIRHSFATRLLEKGADIKTVSELLGHKSIQITLDIYSHVSSDLKNKTISLLD